MDALRLEYLQRIGVPVWVRREAPPAAPARPGLQVGPGAGSVLFVCAGAEEPSGPLAADLARVLAEAPVWAWPAPPEAGTTPADAVERGLLTALVVFGEDLAARLFGRVPPESIGAARVVVVPSMGRLAREPEARRACWRALAGAGLAPA